MSRCPHLEFSEKFQNIRERAQVIRALFYAADEATKPGTRDHLLLGVRILSDDIWTIAEDGEEEANDLVRQEIGSPNWRRPANINEPTSDEEERCAEPGSAEPSA